MAHDYSCQPVDVSMIRDRIVPYIMGQVKIDDLLDQAAGNVITRYRANSWGQGVFGVEQSLIEKLEHAENAGLPGFESDLHVAGRPFFNICEDMDDSFEVMEAYLKLSGQPVENVDEVALSMISVLNDYQDQLDSGLSDDAWDIVNSCYPIEHVLVREDEGFDNHRSEIRAMLDNPLSILREAFDNLGKGPINIVLHGVESEVIPEDVISQVFFECISFSSNIIPGWMGHGRYWPTRLFEEIQVNVSHIFERPTSLFAPIVEKVPYLEAYLETSIVEDYSVGGYVPPEKMGAFIKLLDKYRNDLIFVWEEKKREEAVYVDMPLKLKAPFLKIYEPAVYAERNGYGFIEASEIYSATNGALN